MSESRQETVRQVFRCHAAGIAVVTATGDGQPVGLTVASLTSVCLDPPLLSFNVRSRSSVWRALSRANRLGVNILTDRQDGVAEFFARSLVQQSAEPAGHLFTWVDGVPVLGAVTAWLVCERVDLVTAGDHDIAVCEVIRGRVVSAGPPLVYHQRRYVSVLPTQAVEA
ncbi:flavin reductase family protein [Jiangella sp. DSM 45060]|uniref:flavin reductase family protein n=1 Tax=Jiangella sp. DSM 45060 TaxID=1798224 RepID=UPI000879D301|nr:flavin reductase family protein [Jiangella sp. DSM 45060]SDT37735.1 NADH-FMN oxidoreductase RutF, flavin reductase (DIM6/NTAB) family [Jiangella sp. DSM 45060]